MADYIFPDFESQELAISSAISQVKRHGININLPEQLQKSIQAHILFDGDDGLFKEILKNTDTYFEYGCGKSTEFVYKYTNASIYAVDTSRDWVNKLQSIAITSAPRRVNLNWVDVGKVADWGYPISFERRENFKVYAELMWLEKSSPDLVLIDGRFRVFCFLTSIKFAPAGTKILFDDYINRPFYHVVEEFCERIDTCGRQALFEVSQSAKSAVTDEILSTFQNVIS